MQVLCNDLYRDISGCTYIEQRAQVRSGHASLMKPSVHRLYRCLVAGPDRARLSHITCHNRGCQVKVDLLTVLSAVTRAKVAAPYEPYRYELRIPLVYSCSTQYYVLNQRGSSGMTISRGRHSGRLTTRARSLKAGLVSDHGGKGVSDRGLLVSEEPR
jgi:hypothetical protein